MSAVLRQVSHQSIDVLLVEDHKCVLWGLEKLIDGERPRMRVVATAHNRAEALGAARMAAPDIVLLDLDLNGENSLDFLPELLQQGEARVLVLTGSRDSAMHEHAIFKGARGVVLKDEPADTLIKAIDRVHQGELWLDRATTGRVFTAFASGGAKRVDPEAAKIATLTPKERRIVAAICDQRGAKSQSVAASLHMSEHTLRNHLTSIYTKLDVKNRVELVIYALERDLAQPEAADSHAR
ncbi:MAG: response regulator transcription factor [Steroidobacteraceae bacterium]